MNRTQQKRLMERATQIFDKFRKGKKVFLTAAEVKEYEKYCAKIREAQDKLIDAKKELKKRFKGTYFTTGDHYNRDYYHNAGDEFEYNRDGDKNEIFRIDHPTDLQIEAARATLSEFEDHLVFGEAKDYIEMLEKFQHSLDEISKK